jgi:hypothetical protein
MSSAGGASVDSFAVVDIEGDAISIASTELSFSASEALSETPSGVSAAIETTPHHVPHEPSTPSLGEAVNDPSQIVKRVARPTHPSTDPFQDVPAESDDPRPVMRYPHSLGTVSGWTRDSAGEMRVQEDNTVLFEDWYGGASGDF